MSNPTKLQLHLGQSRQTQSSNNSERDSNNSQNPYAHLEGSAITSSSFTSFLSPTEKMMGEFHFPSIHSSLKNALEG